MASEYAESLRKTPVVAAPPKVVPKAAAPVVEKPKAVAAPAAAPAAAPKAAPAPVASSANVRESRSQNFTNASKTPANTGVSLGRLASGTGSFIANELLGVDDFRNTVSHASRGEWGSAAKSLATGAFEAGSSAFAVAAAIPTFGGSLAARGAVVAGKQGAKQVAKEVVQQEAKNSSIKYASVIPQQAVAKAREFALVGGGKIDNAIERGTRFVEDLAPTKPKIDPIKIPDPRAPKPIEPVKIPDPRAPKPVEPLSPNPPVKPGTYPPYRPGTPSPRPTIRPGTDKSPWSRRSLPDASPLIELGLGTAAAVGTLFGLDFGPKPKSIPDPTIDPTIDPKPEIKTEPKLEPKPKNPPAPTQEEEEKKRQEDLGGFGGGVGQQDVMLKKVF